MLAENPYAPPKTAVSSELPDAPRSFGWEVVGGKVIVKSSSQFPMIDPFTGVSRETMMLRMILLRHQPRWLLAIPAAGVGIAILLNTITGFRDSLILALFGLVGGLVVTAIIGFRMPTCTLRVFFDKRSLRMRSILSNAIPLLFLLSVLSSFFHDSSSSVVNWFSLILPYLWLVALFAAVIFNRRLRCVRMSGERFEIRGFSRKALEALSAEMK